MKITVAKVLFTLLLFSSAVPSILFSAEEDDVEMVDASRDGRNGGMLGKRNLPTGWQEGRSVAKKQLTVAYQDDDVKMVDASDGRRDGGMLGKKRKLSGEWQVCQAKKQAIVAYQDDGDDDDDDIVMAHDAPSAEASMQQTPGQLFKAIEANNIERVRAAIASGVDVNTKKHNNYSSPLFCAVEKRNTAIAELLILSKADVNQQGYYYPSVLARAVHYGGSEAMIQLLIKHEANVDCTGKDGYTPLLIAARNRNLKIVAQLIEGGANVNHCGDDGKSALMLVNRRLQNGLELVKLLKSNGATESKSDEEKLLEAIRDGSMDTVETILGTNSVDVNYYSDISGRTPLTLAAENGHLDMVRLLVENNANVSQLDNPRPKTKKH